MWQTPKTNWQAGDVPVASDFNRIEENLQYLKEGKAEQSELNAHLADNNNPHGVTKAQVGLGNVDNVQQASKTEFNNHVNNKNNPHAVTAAQVGAAPASHVGSGGSAHALATTSAAGFMSPEDKQILNSLNTPKVTGTVQYTDTVGAESTITKYIPIGSGKTRGKMVVQPITRDMAGTGKSGVLIFFEISATRAVVVGGGGAASNSGASSRGLADYLTFGNWSSSLFEEGGIGRGATGSARIGIKNVYISGSNIRIDFYNGYDESDKLNCRIYWEVE